MNDAISALTEAVMGSTMGLEGFDKLTRRHFATILDLAFEIYHALPMDEHEKVKDVLSEDNRDSLTDLVRNMMR